MKGANKNTSCWK